MAKQKQLTIKETFRRGITSRHVEGMGRINFDPKKVDPEDYWLYQERGFDIFEGGKDGGIVLTEGDAKADLEGTPRPDNPTPEAKAERVKELKANHTPTELKNMATELGIEIESGANKTRVAELIAEKEYADAASK